MIDYIFLFLGLAVLFLSGDFLIRSSVSMAGHFKVSKLVIGILVVSFGTSAPELVVSLSAALTDHPDVSIGNVIGSNISNIALILGATAIIAPVKVKKGSILFDWSVLMGAGILLSIFILNGILEFYEGLIFIALLTAFIYTSLYRSRKQMKANNELIEIPRLNLAKSLILMIISSVGLVGGAHLLVDGAIGIARDFGVSERVISVSIVAFGTSIPELATSIMAAIRKELDIFIGNIVGSNIFNILAILGLTALLKELNVSEMVLKVDIIWMNAITVMLFLFILPLRKGLVTRWKGSVFLLIYILYIYIIYV